MAENVDAEMAAIPEAWRTRWCGGERGPCACLGCVQIGNRLAMWEEVHGRQHRGDPEYIKETRIPPTIYAKHKVTKEEWSAWMARNGYV